MVASMDGGLDAVPHQVVLAPGVRVPYSVPIDPCRQSHRRANRRVDSRAEVYLRSALHRMGLRFRKDRLIRCDPVKVHVDIAFGPARVAAFVDGCFWDSCPQHQHIPTRNFDYWVPKFESNVVRDRRVDAALTDHGWLVIRT